MSKNIPKVSVILPTYNRTHLIGRAIKGVLNQTYQDFEVIVVDDASTDNTEEVIRGFQKCDERIKYIKHKENKGGAAARNTGIKIARGEYIAFQDSDDEWLPEKLEKQMRVFENSPADTGVVYSDMLRINKKGKIIYWHSPEVLNGQLINPETLNYQVINLGIQSTLIKKTCLNIVGLFDERFPRYIDLEIFIRLSKYCHFVHIKEPLVKYYANQGISSNNNALVIAVKLLLEKYSEEAMKDIIFLAGQYFYIGLALCSVGKFKKGRKYFLRAIKICPLNIKNLMYLGAVAASLLGQGGYDVILKICQKIRKL